MKLSKRIKHSLASFERDKQRAVEAFRRAHPIPFLVPDILAQTSGGAA